jgi:YD repeat-containing protein
MTRATRRFLSFATLRFSASLIIVLQSAVKYLAMFLGSLWSEMRTEFSRLRLPHRADGASAFAARGRFTASGFQRALSIVLIVIMISNQALASPAVSQAMANTAKGRALNAAQDLRFWWHSSGWAAYARAAFARQVGNPPPGQIGGERRPSPPKPQEKQSDRDARVTHIEIRPGDVTVGVNEPVVFVAVAYDKDNAPVGGARFTWSGLDEGRQQAASVSPTGLFVSSVEGNFKVTAQALGRQAHVKVKVQGTKLKRDGQPVGIGQSVSTRDLPPAKPKDTSSLPRQERRERLARAHQPGAARFLAASFVSPRTSRAPAAMPAPQMGGGDDIYGWNGNNYWSADDPGRERGDPPGRSETDGAGSNNFELTAPVLALEGRGMDLSLALQFNSRVWHKPAPSSTEITFDIDRDWPAPGWSLGFGKIIGMGSLNSQSKGYMLIEADGTRHGYTGTVIQYPSSQTFTGHTTDSTLIDYYVDGDSVAGGGAPIVGWARFSNGTYIHYSAAGANAIYPAYIEDTNGNMTHISYRNNQGPQIDTITDTLGRVIQFHYDANNLLTAITAPGLNGGTRTLVRLNYREHTWSGANFGFDSSLTTRVRNGTAPIQVIKAIYYPGNSTGYWFGDADSYSSYGMIAKVIEQRGMGFDNAPLTSQGTITQGTITQRMSYNYPLSPSNLTDVPTYTQLRETWAAIHDGAPGIVGGETLTTYAVTTHGF